MDRFAILHKQRPKDPPKQEVKNSKPNQTPTFLIIILSIFLVLIIFLSGERWIPPQFGFLFACLLLFVLLGLIYLKRLQK